METYCLKIKLDKENVISQRKYRLNSLYEALDYLFVEKLGLVKKEKECDTVVYLSESPNAHTYEEIIGMCLSLKKNCKWFTENVQEWKLCCPMEGEEDLMEDLLHVTFFDRTR